VAADKTETVIANNGQTVAFDPNDPASVVAAAEAALVFTRTSDFKSVFSDVNRLRVGNGTVTVTFSKITHSPSVQANPNIIEEQAEVTMSWVQFKMAVLNCVSLLSAIEAEVGSIPLPKSHKINDERNRTAVRALGMSQS
jgi:hypothetical protein